MKKHFVILGAVLLAGGCSLAPKMQTPETPQPAAFKEASDETLPGTWKVGEPSAHLPRGEWWTVFKDPALDRLMARANAENLTVQAMAARVKQARATADIASSFLFPTVDGNASAVRQKITGASFGGPANIPIQNVYKAGLGLNYEIDLFGSVLNDRRAAKADLKSAESGFESVKLAMQADVAQLYFTYRALEAEHALLTRAVKLREDSLGILKKRLDAGFITELDLSEATVDLETTRSEMLRIDQARKETLHALAILQGQAPAGFDMEKGGLAAQTPAIPAGLPSDLLERRPDIASAQHDLAAANARIGIARAAFFPSIVMTGTGGFESSLLRDLFQWSSRTWSIGPMLTTPIFGAGRALANHRRSKARYEESVADYRLRVLEAFRDVENGLAALKTLSGQAQAQKTAEKAAKRSAELAGLRYDSGDIGYLENITAQRNLLDVERAGLQIQGQRLSQTVALVRALGGGW